MPESSACQAGQVRITVASALRLLRAGINAVVLALLACPVAHAEPSPIEACRKASSDAERIACLEAALTSEQSRSKPATRDADGQPSDSPRTGQPRSTGGPPAESEPVDGIGARQVRSRNQTSADVTATLESAKGLRVAKYVEVPYRRLQIELENGQIWRQITGDTQRFRVDLERNQSVDIEESRISGYRLRLNEIGRTIRVERIR